MKLRYALLIALLALAAPAWAASDEAKAFETIFRNYDAIRVSLAARSLEQLAERAGAIATAALEADAQAKKRDDYSPCCDAPAQIAKAADQLAAATDLAEARKAFAALSTPMVRYREHASVSGFVKVYCPMKDATWLQRDGDPIGNPFMGPKMARCGQVRTP